VASSTVSGENLGSVFNISSEGHRSESNESGEESSSNLIKKQIYFIIVMTVAMSTMTLLALTISTFVDLMNLV
jgi:hypothetical protein